MLKRLSFVLILAISLFCGGLTGVENAIAGPMRGYYQEPIPVTALNENSPNAREMDLSCVSNGATKYKQISGVFGYNEGHLSKTTLGLPPNKVTSLKASVTGSDEVDLSWKAPKDANSYNIYRSVNSSSKTFELVGSSKTSAFVDRGLTAETQYYYKVSAVNNNGEGALSSTIRAKTKGKSPDGVANLNISEISTNALVMTWGVVNDARSYKIYRATSVDGIFKVIGTSSKPSFTNKSLTPSTKYYYKVSAVNTNGEGPLSAAVMGLTKGIPPVQVSKLKMANATSDRITLTWQVANTATNYSVYRSSLSSTSSFVLVGTCSDPTYTDANVTPSTTYYYKVSAVNENGEGSQSSAIKCTTKSVMLTQVNGLSGTTKPGQLNLTWNSVLGATSYKVYRSTGTEDNFRFFGTTKTTSFTDKCVVSNSTYFYKVSAANSRDEGIPSEVISITTPDFKYLFPNLYVQSDNPEIIDLAKTITAGLSSDYEKSKAIHDWVASNIAYDIDAYLTGKYGDVSALATLHKKTGICAGYANLNAALHRAVGIPAKLIDGVAIWGGPWDDVDTSKANHGWNEIFADNRWVIEDPTWDSGIVDLTDKTFEFHLTHRWFDPSGEDFAVDHLKLNERV